VIQNIGEHYKALNAVIEAQLRVFPEHAAYLDARFGEHADLAFANELAGLILKVTGDQIERFCEDYKWLVGVILEEEIFFRRENRYRLSTFAEAEAAIYANRTYMTRYVDGILMSQLWWANHTAVMQFFRESYLPRCGDGARHLEIGPGHGLYLYLASQSERCASVEGWDVSPASIALVEGTFRALKPAKQPRLALVNMFDAPAAQFDSVMLSEVLEHLEDPLAALRAIHGLLAPGGRACINVPVNSPAPDHIMLFRTPEEVVDVISQAGFRIGETLFAPATGVTLERARKRALTISAVVVAYK